MTDLRDHEQNCEHGFKSCHGPPWPVTKSREGWCLGGRPVNLDIVAGILSTIAFIPARVHPETVARKLRDAIEMSYVGEGDQPSEPADRIVDCFCDEFDPGETPEQHQESVHGDA